MFNSNRSARNDLQCHTAHIMQALLGESPAQATRLAKRWYQRRDASRTNWKTTAGVSLSRAQRETSQMRVDELARLGAFLNQESRRGQGVVLVTIHMGDYLRALFAVLRLMPHRRVGIVRRKEADALEAGVFDKLSEFGIEFEVLRSRDKAIGLKMHRLLRRGGVCVLLFDLPGRFGNAVELRFFNAKVHWVRGPVAVAARANAVLVPFVAYDDAGPRFDLQPLMTFEDNRTDDDHLNVCSQRLAAIAERYVRRFPDQWLHWHLIPEMMADTGHG